MASLLAVPANSGPLGVVLDQPVAEAHLIHCPRALVLGDRGDDVKVLQRALNRYFVDNTPVDGVYGKETETFVITFQANKHILADAVVGPETWKALGEC